MVSSDKDKLKALEQAVQQIDRQFGKGALVRLGDKPQDAIQAISSGSIAVDAALGIGGVPRGRVIEVFGPESSGKTTIEDNIKSMVDIAKANKIKVVLSSVLPAYEFGWNPSVKPAEKIAALNLWIKNYCSANKIVYLDYYSSLVDDRKGLKKEYSEDGVHPNNKGYFVMEPLAEEAIAKAMKRR